MRDARAADATSKARDARTTVSPNCGDDDGLTAAQEIEAGLNPCRSDSDGDGCGDAEQLLLAGCADPRRQKLKTECFVDPDGSTTLQFVAPSTPGGVWTRLTLSAPQAAELQISAIEPPGDSTTSGATFYNVASGSQLRFVVRSRGPFAQLQVFDLRLVAADGQVVDTGKVLAYELACPIVI